MSQVTCRTDLKLSNKDGFMIVPAGTVLDKFDMGTFFIVSATIDGMIFQRKIWRKMPGETNDARKKL